ncbi:uncharacterized protein LOC122502708 [Leptopilina heterotoma]|uniref:uncharacterized protein LOC122502701 n=1 Tax=Leptopilina heterotoma TaxID=63436 RepID=UPI001CA8C8B1|nr:uncharacterized protein LOC122502701 [Leptopilina heterotoma]XP_043468811.1 uncharacterized protein LOC122502708 [Leptopilina heterotoma]
MSENLENSAEKSVKNYYWKGKKVTKKVYENRCRMQNVGKNLRSVYGIKNVEPNLKNDSNCEFVKCESAEGRRIVHLKTLAEQLNCKNCKSVLSLTDIVNEKRFGLASVFNVKCNTCLLSTQVSTDKQHIVSGPNMHKHFDVNTKVVVGTLNGGMGNTHLNKILSSLNIPEFRWNNFKVHEKEVGIEAEKMAHASCLKAAKEERKLTIEKYEEVKRLLPSNLNVEFMFPDIPNIPNLIVENFKISAENKVRIAASFDMGWFTRGTGRTYDSISGTGSLIGFFSKKVLSYATFNRKCRMCENGHAKDDHDCRLNFEGSAKAMEPQAAVEIIANNSILKECNLEVGVMIGDNDSSAICAARNASAHDIVKQSDINHTSKGLTNELFKIQSRHKELNATSIKYLQKCFNYSIAQNKGNCDKLSQAIQNIPYHCFNIHDNCGTWCTFSENPETYKHANIDDGFQDEKLFEDLKCLFNIMAKNANRFAAGVSSNPNESLNATIVSKAPKSRVYGMSTSSDVRVACSINKKNEGEKYVPDLLNKLNVSPGQHTKKYTDNVDEKNKKRYLKSQTRPFKKRRLFLKKQKTELRNKKELSEGTNYSPNIGLLTALDETIPLFNGKNNFKPIVIFFDLETGSLKKDTDILQIAAKYKDYQFSVYISPSQKISEEASLVNGLRYINGQLLLHGKPVESVSLMEAILAFYEFLYFFGKKCILAAHNCKFDYPRLMLAIAKVFMSKHFGSIVAGFSDSLPLIARSTGKKGKGQNKLENLAKDFDINTDEAHNAICDVQMLEQVLIKLKISDKQIVEASVTWDAIEKKTTTGKKSVIGNRAAIRKKAKVSKGSTFLNQLDLLNECTTYATRKKIAAANITYENIVDAYKENKFMGLLDILGVDENGNVKVTKQRRVINKIVEFLEKNSK